MSEYDAGHLTGYAAGLRAALDAVRDAYATAGFDYGDTDTPTVHVHDVVAAITAKQARP